MSHLPDWMREQMRATAERNWRRSIREAIARGKDFSYGEAKFLAKLPPDDELLVAANAHRARNEEG